MAQILLLAQSAKILHYAEQVKRELQNPTELEVVLAHMDDASKLAKQHIRPDTEIVMARSYTVDLLRSTGIPLPIVEIPVGNNEIISSVMRARELAPKNGIIGFLGFDDILGCIIPFLDSCGIRVAQYDLRGKGGAPGAVAAARQDGVCVLISGEAYKGLAESFGIQHVLMDSSIESIRAGYERSRAILDALLLDKTKSREKQIIFDTVSDAIISLDDSFKVTMLNRKASIIFGDEPGIIQGKPAKDLFTKAEQDIIRDVLHTGEEKIGGIMERERRKYAMRIVPIIVDRKTRGVVITLQGIYALQQMEVTVRKGLRLKGNVAKYEFADIKGSSPLIRETIDAACSFAGLESSVLIIGETGTGKELFAQSIHNASSRRNGPFVAVNCGSISSQLMESELFGYEEGAFTGARKGGKEGLFEQSHGGTIFLDEISEMDASGQVNLLRVLQERQIRRIGGNDIIPIDVRVIAASNRELVHQMDRGLFRRDLYYRLSVLVLELPPLRNRTDDVIALANHFIGQYARKMGKSLTFSAEALSLLQTMNWDGNIRQLRNVCERLAAVSTHKLIEAEYIRKYCPGDFPQNREKESTIKVAHRVPVSSYADAVIIKGKIYDKMAISNMFAASDGKKARLAANLGISRATLWKYLKKLGMHGSLI